MKSVTTYEAKTHLSRLLAEVEAGQEIIIRRGSVEIAKLVPLQGEPSVRPEIGTVTSEPFEVPDEALAPMTDEELAQWGL